MVARRDALGRPLQADSSLGTRAGITDIKPIDRLNADLAAWVGAGRRLRADPAPGAIARATPSPVQNESPLRHFVTWLQQAQPSAPIESAYTGVARTRMVKSALEIGVMRRAARIGVYGIAHAAAFVNEGVDERGLEAELEAFYTRGGARRPRRAARGGRGDSGRRTAVQADRPLVWPPHWAVIWRSIGR